MDKFTSITLQDDDGKVLGTIEFEKNKFYYFPKKAKGAKLIMNDKQLATFLDNQVKIVKKYEKQGMKGYK